MTRPEGERGARMREEGREERGPKAHSKNSDFGTPYDLCTLSWPFKGHGAESTLEKL